MMTPALLLLEDVEEAIGGVAIGDDKSAEVLGQQRLGGAPAARRVHDRVFDAARARGDPEDLDNDPADIVAREANTPASIAMCASRRGPNPARAASGSPARLGRPHAGQPSRPRRYSMTSGRNTGSS